MVSNIGAVFYVDKGIIYKLSFGFRQSVPSGGITNAFQDTGHPTIADCLAASGQTMP